VDLSADSNLSDLPADVAVVLEATGPYSMRHDGWTTATPVLGVNMGRLGFLPT